MKLLLPLFLLATTIVQGRGNVKEPKERQGHYATDSSTSGTHTAPVAIPHSVFDKAGNLVPSRFDYKYSLKHPFHVSDNKTVPFYKLTGSSYVQENRVIKLTDDRVGLTGGVWAETPVPYKEWQITVGFKASGQSSYGGKGLALWYVDQPKVEGDVYGYRNKWNGLAIMMDSFDDDGKVILLLLLLTWKIFTQSHIRWFQRY
jgi:hypothetical protein